MEELWRIVKLKKSKKSLIGWTFKNIIVHYERDILDVGDYDTIFIFPKRNKYHSKKIKVTIEEL